MTKAEAIEVFNNPTEHIKWVKEHIVFSQYFVEAMEMAINALEKEESKAVEKPAERG